jgi:hypothetical protein
MIASRGVTGNGQLGLIPGRNRQDVEDLRNNGHRQAVDGK